jgi:hypothetical protein
MSEQKVSLLINRQVPEFVRDEYPTFIRFLEAYYEFLENKQTGKNNDLNVKSKDLRYLSDVDYSIGQFEDSFFNTFADLLPKDVQVDKAFLIKQLLPFYLAKGNEQSFKLLFRLLFAEEVEIVQPKSNILRASDGKWVVEKAFRITQGVYSSYTANGNTSSTATESGNTIFKMAQVASSSEIGVYVNGVLQTSGYNVRRESKKVVFTTAPSANSEIKILYNDFDYVLLENRKLTGTTSGATAIVERVGQKTLSTGSAFELYVNDKTLVGNFDNGENATLNIIGDNDELINIEVEGLSTLAAINVIDGGASYNIGDPVLISGGGATTSAEAIVSDVFSGFINKVLIAAGGAGFKIGSNVNLVGTTANASLVLAIDGVDISGANSANSFVVDTSRIANYTSVTINAADYGFPNTAISENVNSRIIDALAFSSITSIGPITNVAVLFANAIFSTVPTLDADSAPFINGASEEQHVLFTKSLGRITINTAGDSYKIGDELIFTNPGNMNFGFGAAAAVLNVSATGAITNVALQPPRITGTANVFGVTNVTVIGTGTYFLDELRVGDQIIINNESRYINTISSNTSLTVNANFNSATTGLPKKIGLHGLLPVGGINYDATKLPSITVSSIAGANANLSVTCLMGDGENLNASADQNPGAVLKIRIVNPGAGYQSPPTIDLTNKGSGTATANSVIEPSYVSFPGSWKTSDGILSSAERVIQGRDYYIDYAYVLSSKVEFSKFKELFKNLIHPAGFKQYADFKVDEIVAANNISINSYSNSVISGTVNVNSSIYVTGTNTKFLLAQSLGIISVGSSIAVNSEIKFISSIANNTELIVTSAFTNTANLQEMVVLSTALQPFIIFTESVTNLPLTTEAGELITLQ